MLCPDCRATLPGDYEYCAFCGTHIAIILCPDCGATLSSDWEYCAICGTHATNIIPRVPWYRANLHKWLGALVLAGAAWWVVLYHPVVIWQIMWWLLVGLVFLALTVVGIYELTKDSYLQQAGFFEIDQMDGVSFERYLQALFRGLGYSVDTTPASGDFGADLVISKDRVRAVVQAKRSAKNVGVRAVQEVLGAARFYGCQKSFVVTNRHFTAQAQQLAQANAVELWDRDALETSVMALPQSRSKGQDFLSVAGPVLEILFCITAFAVIVYFANKVILVVLSLWLLGIALKGHKF